MPDWIAVIILGIIEGITEFIPISSTGHLLIAEKWLAKSPGDLFNVAPPRILLLLFCVGIASSGQTQKVCPVFFARSKLKNLFANSS